MKPFILSQQEFMETKCGWKQQGENVMYEPRKLRYQFLDND